ncbi:MAG: Rne/Rng family ribonuclease [Armatimonadota bacterium]
MAILENERLAELKIEHGHHILGSVYKGRVENVVRALDAAFVNIGLERNAFLYVADATAEEPRIRGGRPQGLPPITKVLKPGQEVLVQVTKGPVGRKGARVSARISLPGRYTVLMAQSGKKVGVSRKIESIKERERLRRMGGKVRPKDFGLIIRTQAQGITAAQLQRDVRFLQRIWRSIQHKAKDSKAPALVHEDIGLPYVMLRDVFSSDMSAFVVDDPELYKGLRNLIGGIAPKLRSRIKLYEGAKPIFEHYGVDEQLEQTLRSRVTLPQGGVIVIEETEALTAIDVNSGKFTESKSLANTVLQTNLEAVEEIGRQLRLRDIGGIIVIDFIDMDRARHRRQVMTALRKTLKADRMKTRIAHLTPLGLVEMTRKRTGESLREKLYSTCPQCEGRGGILSPEAVASNCISQLRRSAAKSRARAFLVMVHPSVIPTVLGEEGEGAEELEKLVERDVYVRSSEDMHPERSRVTSLSKRDTDRAKARYRAGRRVKLSRNQVLSDGTAGHMASVDGYTIIVPEGIPAKRDAVEVRLTDIGHSFAKGTVVTPSRRRSRK